MKDVPIPFPVDFDKDEVSPLQLGRLYLGEDQRFVARLFFNTKGALCIAVSDLAIKEGAVVVYEEPSGDSLFGFPPR
jgi:hypothetical protein